MRGEKRVNRKSPNAPPRTVRYRAKWLKGSLTAIVETAGRDFFLRFFFPFRWPIFHGRGCLKYFFKFESSTVSLFVDRSGRQISFHPLPLTLPPLLFVLFRGSAFVQFLRPDPRIRDLDSALFPDYDRLRATASQHRFIIWTLCIGKLKGSRELAINELSVQEISYGFHVNRREVTKNQFRQTRHEFNEHRVKGYSAESRDEFCVQTKCKILLFVPVNRLFLAGMKCNYSGLIIIFNAPSYHFNRCFNDFGSRKFSLDVHNWCGKFPRRWNGFRIVIRGTETFSRYR